MTFADAVGTSTRTVKGDPGMSKMSSVMRRHIACVVAAAAMGLTATADAGPLVDRIKNGEPIRQGIANDSPYGFVGKDGRYVGIEVELAAQVLKEMGAKDVEPTVTTFGGLIPGIQAGRFEIASDGIYIRPERCRVVQFAEPHFMFGAGAFIKKGNTKINVTSMEELARDKTLKLGKLTGGAEDKAYVAAGGNREQIADFTDRASMAAAVKSGRIDVGLVTAMGAAAAAANDPELQLITPFKPPTVNGKLFVYYAAFAFNKADKDFVADFSKRLKAIVQSPAYKEILARYNVPTDVIPDADANVEEICKQEL
jgi:polar amino acid transport system substrate-binding protein